MKNRRPRKGIAGTTTPEQIAQATWEQVKPEPETVSTPADWLVGFNGERLVCQLRQGKAFYRVECAGVIGDWHDSEVKAAISYSIKADWRNVIILRVKDTTVAADGKKLTKRTYSLELRTRDGEGMKTLKGVANVERDSLKDAIRNWNETAVTERLSVKRILLGSVNERREVVREFYAVSEEGKAAAEAAQAKILQANQEFEREALKAAGLDI